MPPGTVDRIVSLYFSCLPKQTSLFVHVYELYRKWFLILFVFTCDRFESRREMYICYKRNAAKQHDLLRIHSHHSGYSMACVVVYTACWRQYHESKRNTQHRPSYPHTSSISQTVYHIIFFMFLMLLLLLFYVDVFNYHIQCWMASRDTEVRPYFFSRRFDLCSYYFSRRFARLLREYCAYFILLAQHFFYSWLDFLISLWPVVSAELLDLLANVDCVTLGRFVSHEITYTEFSVGRCLFTQSVNHRFACHDSPIMPRNWRQRNKNCPRNLIAIYSRESQN